jgi:hypothetical protein
LHYVLDIEVSNLDPVLNTCDIVGSNVMTIQSKSASLDEFTIRLRDQYTIPNAYVNGATPVTVTTASETTRVVTLDRTYTMDEVFTLTIEYQGNSVDLPEAGGTITVDTQPDGTPVVATLSQPYFAYTWWPVKEGDVGEPGDNSDKATMEFHITAPDTFDAPCNGLLQGVEVLDDNRKRHHWASDYAVIPSLVAFAATEYNTWTAYYSHARGTMPVDFYIYPEWDNPDNRAAWELSIDMIGTFASLFGEYPFINEKYGIYNFPWGGLEHQTMTGQGNEGGYTGFGEYLTAHELAHQWWGDAVSCKTWNHIWISEGFASYADVLWDENKPGGGFELLQDEMIRRRTFIGDAYDDGSVYVYDDELDTLWKIFSVSTTYFKGSWALHMLRRLLGDEAFFDALLAFRAAFEYKAATTDDFQAICEDFYEGEGLRWFFQQWIYSIGIPAYWWGWDAVQINGQHYLLLSIDQFQLSSYPRFTAPIDFGVDGTIVTVFNNAVPQYFVVPVASEPTSLELDPDAWLLFDDPYPSLYVPGPPTIVETSPAPGEIVHYSDIVDTVTVTFHTNVNATESDISLVGTNTGPVSFTIASGSDVNPIVMNLATPLVGDAYTLTVTGGVVAANSGMALDGEVADPNDPGSLPSGNGVAGGDAVIQFLFALMGDYDNDGDVDTDDLGEFETCFTGEGGGPITPACSAGDFDLDDDIDCADFDDFLLVWTPPGDLPTLAQCPVVRPFPAQSPHNAPKNRYISINPQTNPTTDTVIKVQVAEMRRCQNAPTRGCMIDSDCDEVCDDVAGDPPYHTLKCPPADCSTTVPPSTCIASGPCVDLAPTFDPPLSWVVQQPIQDPTGGCKRPECPPYPPGQDNCCQDDDWMAYLGATVPELTGGYTSWADVWTDLPAGVLHIAGCPIVPAVTYAVYACSPENLDQCSEALMISTAKFPVNARPTAFPLYADVCGGTQLPGPTVLPPDGYVSVKDLLIENLTIINYGGYDLPQMHLTWADLHGAGTGIPPNYSLSVSDLMAVYVFGLVNSHPYVNTQGGLDPQDCP